MTASCTMAARNRSLPAPAAFAETQARLRLRGELPAARPGKTVVCDDFSRVYDDGERHRVDLEEQGNSPWESDINPLLYSTDALPGAAILGRLYLVMLCRCRC